MIPYSDATVADMLTPMKRSRADVLVRDCRTTARLSIRGLAEEAGVAASTVTRIEAGQLNPTLAMLETLLEAAGQQLTVSVIPIEGPRRPQLKYLTDAWQTTPAGDELDWTRLRGFLDYLALHPEAALAAIRHRPPRSGSPIMDTVLAGIAEKVADDSNIERPRWAGRVAPLNQDYSGAAGTSRMRAAWRAATPPQLRRRGLVIDERSLWRDRENVGV